MALSEALAKTLLSLSTLDADLKNLSCLQEVQQKTSV